MAGRKKSALRARSARIHQHFDIAKQQVYLHSEFAAFLRNHGHEFDLPPSYSTAQLISVLMEGGLREVELSPEPRTGHAPSTTRISRYVWKEASPYSMALSLRPGAYLTHASATYLHGLTDQIPHTIYVNKEQSPKPSGGNLSQESMDRAFANNPRLSSYAFRYGDYRIVLLSGKNTGRLEVTRMDAGPHGLVEVTKIERTLIDATVRPSYAGGVHEVLQVFIAAKGRISIPTLIATYKKLDYVYPYHQAIGFYMAKAGYGERELARLRSLGLSFDFYLTHRMGQKSYDSDWRLYFPTALQ